MFVITGYTNENQPIFHRQLSTQKELVLLFLKWIRGKARLDVKKLSIEKERMLGSAGPSSPN